MRLSDFTITGGAVVPDASREGTQDHAEGVGAGPARWGSHPAGRLWAGDARLLTREREMRR